MGVVGCGSDGSSTSAGGASATGGSAGSSSGGSTNTGGASGASNTGGSSGAAGSGASAGAGGAGIVPCTLTDSGPVSATADGQHIENLHIVTDGTPGIEVNGFSDVVIHNVWIEHKNAAGIALSNADRASVDNVLVEHTGAPASGQNPSSDLLNISCYASAAPQVTRAKLSRGSSGIYLLQCPDSDLSFIQGYDMRGPFPRGQLVQWDKSDRGSLTDFSMVNPATSWPEDNVNMYQSLNMTVARGFIDGNNSPSGIGVIFDGDTSTGTVEDVDAVHMGNGCFSAYAGADGSVFRRTGCRDNICTDQGRGVPSSNALMWCGKPGLTQLRIEASEYFAACNPTNIVWPTTSFAVVETTENDFTPRAPLDLKFCWE